MGWTMQRVVEIVARQYGVSEESLEAGTYSPKQMEVLRRLFDKAMVTKSDKDRLAYVEQKAKYLTAR